MLLDLSIFYYGESLTHEMIQIISIKFYNQIILPKMKMRAIPRNYFMSMVFH